MAFSGLKVFGRLAPFTERGYPLSKLSERLAVSKHAHSAWRRKVVQAASGNTDKDAEIRRLKRELAPVSKARDILEKAAAYFARGAK